MTTPKTSSEKVPSTIHATLPSALDTATFAVTLLENCPLFNSGHGAVFTRDGINELEASVMVTRGFAKRAVGVMGLRRVKNPILLARAILEHGDQDLIGKKPGGLSALGEETGDIDAPSAQGHTQIHGPTAEVLAQKYGLDMVDPSYYFTQLRWDQHIAALEKEKSGEGLGTWSEHEYLPQGTCGAVALDEAGVICTATSTGGLTNKLTGRIGDTPVPGAGFWAEEWVEQHKPHVGHGGSWADGMARRMSTLQPLVTLSSSLQALLADCLPTPFLYSPLPVHNNNGSPSGVTRSVAVSGTGNGDSFLRVCAARSVGAIARFKGVPSAQALSEMTGPGGELQRSAGDRWGVTGEGEGGIIGIEHVVIWDDARGVIDVRSSILQDFNCNGMFRAWVDDDGGIRVRIWREA